MKPPKDLRLFALKYSERCRTCGASVKVGELAHWSPSEKAIWCVACTSGQSPSASGPQALWQRLCGYAHRCIEAEATKSLVPHTGSGSLWFLHAGAEQLVAGQNDSTPAPRELADRLNSDPRQESKRSIIYGWPTVVVIDRDRVRKVAPLFVALLEPERAADGGWQLHATVEPEFNLAITASGIFDPSITEEISDLLGHGLPFGDADAVTDLAGRTADLLGLEVLSGLDPKMLDSHVGREQGIYNAAVSVVTDVLSPYTINLRKELQELQTRKDWTTTAAAHLIPGDFGQREDKRPPSGPLAAPLECNQSQEETLDRLRREPLTIVTGPPGTGKTQLVVNAVSNAWLDSHSVLVTSTNNAAVDVAVDRAERDVCSGLLLRTGNRMQREEVPGRITAALAQAEKYDGDRAQARAQLQQNAIVRTQLMERLARLDALDRELLPAVGSLDEAESALGEAARTLWTGANPPGLPISSRGIERRARRLLKTWFFHGFRVRRLRRRLGCIETAPVAHVVTWARTDQRVSRLASELATKRAEHRRLEAAVGDTATSVPEANRKWSAAGLAAIRAETGTRIRSGAHRLAAFGTTPAGGYRFRNAIVHSFQHLRGWACTALSAQSNFPLDPGLFDLVIVDEASQCSLAAVLPLAYRAKRLAVVGDPNQLQPIVSLGDGLLRETAAQAEFQDDDLRRCGIHHKDGSAYFAFEFAAKPGTPVLLNEHYRCHPHIARWFNRVFYEDRLSVLTDVSGMVRHDRAVGWIDVEGAAEQPGNGRSWLNWAEAKQTVERLRSVMSGDTTVGVVTPFAAQARLIERLAEEEFGRDFLEDADFVCGTAHSLQGNERDAIVISPVISPGMSKFGARWIEKERNLLNVAVSRARRALIVLGHPLVGDLGSPTLASLRAYLRDEMARKERPTPSPALFRTDSRSEELLLAAMQQDDLLPYPKLNVDGYELDFALLEQGIKLNIEVDGDQHLDTRGQQRRQDLTRDRILVNLGWDVLRIPAWRCHTELESVIDQIRKTRDRLHDGVPARKLAHEPHSIESSNALVRDKPKNDARPIELKPSSHRHNADPADGRAENAEVLGPTETAKGEFTGLDTGQKGAIEELEMQPAAAAGDNRGKNTGTLAVAAVLITALIVGGSLLSRAGVDGSGPFCPTGLAWDQARAFVGQRGTFRGEVVGTNYVERSTTQPTFLNIGRPFPDSSRLTVVVWGRDRGRFPQPPEVAYAAGQEICVSGEVSLFEGVVQIEVDSPSAVSVR